MRHQVDTNTRFTRGRSWSLGDDIASTGVHWKCSQTFWWLQSHYCCRTWEQHLHVYMYTLHVWVLKNTQLFVHSPLKRLGLVRLGLVIHDWCSSGLSLKAWVGDTCSGGLSSEGGVGETGVGDTCSSGLSTDAGVGETAFGVFAGGGSSLWGETNLSVGWSIQCHVHVHLYIGAQNLSWAYLCVSRMLTHGHTDLHTHTHTLTHTHNLGHPGICHRMYSVYEQQILILAYE